MPFRQIPSRLRSRAFEAGNGELLWPGPVALRVSNWLARVAIGILGGEIYLTGLTHGWGTYVRAWSTQPGWGGGEPWSAFVERSRLQAIDHIKGAGADHALVDVGSSSLSAGQVLFFLAACGEGDYARQWTGAAHDSGPGVS
jgi:hypothetical protein